MQPGEEPAGAPPASKDGSTISHALQALALRLREARRESRLSQEAVAHEVGCTTRSLTRWENGECDAGFVTVRSLARLYGVSLDWMAGRTALRGVLEPGTVLVDEDVLDAVRSLAEKGAQLCDVPSEMIRNPGIDYAFVVPQHPSVHPMEAARKLEEEVQGLMDCLARRPRP